MSTNGNTATVYDYTRLAEIGKHRLTGYAGLENAGLEGEEQSVTTGKCKIGIWSCVFWSSHLAPWSRVFRISVLHRIEFENKLNAINVDMPPSKPCPRSISRSNRMPNLSLIRNSFEWTSCSRKSNTPQVRAIRALCEAAPRRIGCRRRVSVVAQSFAPRLVESRTSVSTIGDTAAQSRQK